MALNKKQLALIHVANRDLAMSDDQYRALLSSYGVDSSKRLTNADFNHLLRRLRKAGFKPVHKSAKKSGMHRRPAVDSADQLGKIGAQLTEMKLPWSYADKIARQMWKIDRVRWCDGKQLRGIITALNRRQQRLETETDRKEKSDDRK